MKCYGSGSIFPRGGTPDKRGQAEVWVLVDCLFAQWRNLP